jgi:Na+/H+ antiporter NhaD/arsenite permease-like protein
MIVVFVLGYLAIALEHRIKVDKAASALLIGVVTWAIYALNATEILSLGINQAWNDLIAGYTMSPEHLNGLANHFVKHELGHHLIEISEILFFLLGAMTIVEVVDHHQGFKIITDKITTTNKVKLLWIIGILTFFMSAALDNLTTTIVMLTLLKKLIDDKETRWLYASIVVLTANAGGAWSPIGDVTTIMLWIGGQITALNIILKVMIPSLVSAVVPLAILSFTMKGDVSRPQLEEAKEFTTEKERNKIFFIGVSALLFVPVFKTVTHLPPYMGMLLGLGVIWLVTDLMHKHKPDEDKRHLSVISVLSKVDVPTVFFFLGILTAVASLQSAGHLVETAQWLDTVTGKNVYVIDAAIGVLSSIVDNVPLVAGAMGMYEISHTTPAFMVDGTFWELLAYTAGTGGSILIIGSAAGVAAMGIEKIEFGWYMKKISLLALLGYFAGIGAFAIQDSIIHIQGEDDEIEQVNYDGDEHNIRDQDILHLKSEMILDIKREQEHEE